MEHFKLGARVYSGHKPIIGIVSHNGRLLVATENSVFELEKVQPGTCERCDQPEYKPGAYRCSAHRMGLA